MSTIKFKSLLHSYWSYSFIQLLLLLIAPPLKATTQKAIEQQKKIILQKAQEIKNAAKPTRPEARVTVYYSHQANTSEKVRNLYLQLLKTIDPTINSENRKTMTPQQVMNLKNKLDYQTVKAMQELYENLFYTYKEVATSLYHNKNYQQAKLNLEKSLAIQKIAKPHNLQVKLLATKEKKDFHNLPEDIDNPQDVISLLKNTEEQLENIKKSNSSTTNQNSRNIKSPQTTTSQSSKEKNETATSSQQTIEQQKKIILQKAQKIENIEKTTPSENRDENYYRDLAKTAKEIHNLYLQLRKTVDPTIKSEDVEAMNQQQIDNLKNKLDYQTVKTMQKLYENLAHTYKGIGIILYDSQNYQEAKFSLEKSIEFQKIAKNHFRQFMLLASKEKKGFQNLPRDIENPQGVIDLLTYTKGKLENITTSQTTSIQDNKENKQTDTTTQQNINESSKIGLPETTELNQNNNNSTISQTNTTQSIQENKEENKTDTPLQENINESSKIGLPEITELNQVNSNNNSNNNLKTLTSKIYQYRYPIIILGIITIIAASYCIYQYLTKKKQELP